ncbi:RagB/SusD family nutrient uptake outer membrane protein [Maribellus sp. CM-23]|uniref:RagB/SusD family nutrient uptake outer membrane protein n=1 Tax=Maribellus sp. CM-23 TaxID=2781026 RepID=UPI001F23578F|nr:RagB/SusD family nutrient uptake outer membrane protein [Maribellus sp. CM-23]MCE4566411.1 RagB/SusD family nutrient uptake outer membrane protein [Maribellus sp. CM-23]
MRLLKNMKTTIALLILITFGFVSCNDYLDIYPGDSPEIKDAFMDRNESEKYLMTCYSYMPRNGNLYTSLPLLGCDEIFYTTDDIQFTAMGSFPLPYLYGYGGTNTSGSPFMNYWDGGNGASSLWDAIRHCNVFLEHMPLEAGGPPNMEEIERKQWIAEVSVLKAYYHYYLFTLYGPIPIVDKAVSTNAGINEFKIHRESIDDVVNYITTTIDNALPDLKDHAHLNLATEAGRITKTIALAIKAQTLVWSASPLFNGNTDFSVVDNRGKQLFAINYDKNKWQLAADALEVALESAESNYFKLHYSDGSEIKGKTPSQETIYRLAVREAVVTHWNEEIIWAKYEDGGSATLQTFAQAFYPGVTPHGKGVGQRQAPPLHIVEQFYSANGVPINVDNDWINNGWYNNRFTAVRVAPENKTEAVEGQVTAQINLNRSHRFYSSICFDRGYWEGLGFEEAEFRHLEGRASEVSGAIGVRSIGMTGYYCKKVCGINNTFLSPVTGTGYQVTPYAFPIIRLTDLKLLYAECLNEIGVDHQEILPILDEVRARSGILPVKEAWDNHTNFTDYDNQIGLREIIRQERLNELAFEGGRFWDTRRWRTALINMNTPVKAWNVWGETVADYYNLVIKQRPSYSFKNYLMPLSETSLVKNPNLVQNPGW